MSIYSFLRSPAFLTGFGLTSSGALGIGGWQFVEEIYPTGHKRLSSQGFKWNPAVPELQADVSSGTHDTTTNGNKYHLQSYGCFQNFFPGATVNHSSAPSTDTMEDSLESAASSVDSGNPIGCALMNLSYEWVTDDDVSFIFKSEITVKNNQFGWALWTGGKRIKTSDSMDTDQKDMSHHLVFLEKKGESWEIIGGYRWSDAGFVVSEYSIQHLRIVPPQQEDWAKEVRDDKAKGNRGFKHWSGFWEELKEKEDAKEVFQDIEVWADSYGKRNETAEILGREFKSGGSEIDFSEEPTIDQVGHGYKKDKGWTKWSNAGKTGYKKVGTILNNLYSPWKGKKGSWKELENYCKNTYSLRSLKDKDLNVLQNLCYRKEGRV